MAKQLLLVLAVKDDKSDCGGIKFVGGDTLYGRYWGCYEDYNSLHFENLLLPGAGLLHRVWLKAL